MKKIVKPKFSSFIMLLMLSLLTVSCSYNNSNEILSNDSDITNIAISDEKPLENDKKDKFDDYETYIEYISNIEDFKPYYKIVFAFENVPNGILNVPIEDVKNMHKDLEKQYEFISINDSSMLSYLGDYKGSTDFVDGYDIYMQNIDNKAMINPINMSAFEYNGETYNLTPLKTVLINNEVSKKLEKYIDEGSSFQESDFILNSQTDNIHVVLGNGYRDLYEIGDVVELEFISNVMKFEVIGFYKENSGFKMELAGEQYVDLDYRITIPHYVPNYEPIGDSQIFQQAFIVGELTSGYIPVEEKVEDLDEVVHNKYAMELEELANKNNLNNMYLYPFWTVSFNCD